MIEHVVKSTNASTLFLLTPVSGQEVELLREYQLIDSYLRDSDREDLTGNLLFVLFRPDDMEFFELFLYTESSQNVNFMEDYNYAGGYIVLVYKIPDKMKDDFEKFKLGQYSKFSKETKSLFKKSTGVRKGFEPLTTLQWDVFSKSSALRKDLEKFVGETLPDDIELYGIPDIEKETLTISKFKHHVETIEPAAKSTEVTKRAGSEETLHLRGGGENTGTNGD